MTSDRRLQAAIDACPTITTKELAAVTQLSRQTVHDFCKRHGITLQDGRRKKASGPSITAVMPQPNEIRDRVSPHLVGASSEMAVCADLLRRGWPTYRACSPIAAAAVVVEIAGQLRRIEVRTAQRQGKSLRYAMPKNDVFYDILALVDGEGLITYKPSIEGATASATD